MKNPQKKNFIQRAHSNPFSDAFEYPDNPDEMNWAEYFKNKSEPKFLDLGCGYGKFLFYLSNQFPEINSIGFEIRKKVSQYVSEKIKYENKDNINVLNTNGMLFLPNFFHAHSLGKIFILFPDPHFKKKKQKARIICRQMLEIYSYVLTMNGRIYISTDVKEYFDEMIKCFENNDDFREEKTDDLIIKIKEETDEAGRAGANKIVYGTCFVKIK